MIKDLGKTKFAKSVNAGGIHRVAYSVYGPDDATEALVILHGMARNRHDYAWLGNALNDKSYKIITVDLAGAGESDRLGQQRWYSCIQHIFDTQRVIEQENCQKVTLMGASYGGYQIMRMGALPHKSFDITSLIINDTPVVFLEGTMPFILQVFGRQTVFDTHEQAVTKLRSNHRDWRVSEEDWEFLIKHSIRKMPDGKFEFTYDLNMVHASAEETGFETCDIYNVWEKITLPTLMLTGERSPLVNPKWIVKMQESNPLTKHVVAKGETHPVNFVRDENIQIIEDWMTEHHPAAN